jgi:hypothetical protein
VLEKLKPCPFCGGDVKIINAEELTINYHRSGGEQVVANCKDCIHFVVCDEVPTKSADDCDFFKDRSRFVELPCKVGDTVYYFNSVGTIYSQRVSGFIVNYVGILIDSDVMFDSNLIGNKFFLTREEAEQALKERGENEK